MLINGISFKVDFTDADFIEKIEIGSKKIYEQAEELKQKKDLTIAEGIRQECKILKDFLDYVLGDGASERLFEGRNSLNECLKAYEDIINARTTQIDEFQSKISKYSPDRFKK